MCACVCGIVCVCVCVCCMCVCVCCVCVCVVYVCACMCVCCVWVCVCFVLCVCCVYCVYVCMCGVTPRLAPCGKTRDAILRCHGVAAVPRQLFTSSLRRDVPPRVAPTCPGRCRLPRPRHRGRTLLEATIPEKNIYIKHIHR